MLFLIKEKLCSKDYYPYLESIGAAMTDENGKKISDAIEGSMCWCPVTSLDSADEAYEWNMGQYFSTDTRDSSKFTSELSKDMQLTLHLILTNSV